MLYFISRNEGFHLQLLIPSRECCLQDLSTARWAINYNRTLTGRKVLHSGIPVSELCVYRIKVRTQTLLLRR